MTEPPFPTQHPDDEDLAGVEPVDYPDSERQDGDDGADGR